MGTVAFFQDLSEIKRLEKELVQAERLASIGQTVAGLAHGIKNILHGLKGGSYLVDIGVKRNDTERLKKGMGDRQTQYRKNFGAGDGSAFLFQRARTGVRALPPQ